MLRIILPLDGILIPHMLLTMKTFPLAPHPTNFMPQDLYARNRWRRAQYLADQFWVRWKWEYLQNLQNRSKWQKREPNLSVEEVDLVKGDNKNRNDLLTICFYDFALNEP